MIVDGASESALLRPRLLSMALLAARFSTTAFVAPVPKSVMVTAVPDDAAATDRLELDAMST
jgi:hypothetical protein